MKREDCWMTFSEALNQFLDNRDERATAPEGCSRWKYCSDRMREACDHMDALTAESPIDELMKTESWSDQQVRSAISKILWKDMRGDL